MNSAAASTSSTRAHAERGSPSGHTRLSGEDIRKSRRPASDYHSEGMPTDHWHASLQNKTVCKRPYSCFGVYFHTNDSSALDPTLGVAMTETEYGRGIEFRNTPMYTLLPPNILSRGTEGMLLITWPGYFHLKYKKTVYLNTTTGDVASQITFIFKEFYQKHHQDFKAPGIRLGPGFMSFERIRLRSMWFDGRFWNLETSYVYDKEEVWDTA